jgi:long-chain acyl-CoA synthetase
VSESIGTSRSPVSVGSILEASYAQYAHRPALLDGSAVRSYAELGERVHRVADALRKLGGRPGDRVALLSDNCPAYIETTHAAFVGGFVRVALSAKLHPREVVDIVADCEPRFLAVGPEWLERLAGMRDELNGVDHVICLGEAGDDATVMDFASLVALGDPSESGPPPAPDDLCALLYTSGTTGRPKGAMLTHGNWSAMIRNSLVELPSVGADDVLLHIAPLSHFSGYVEPTYSARGAMHIVEPTFDAARAIEAIERHRVTALALVPTILNLLLPAVEAAGAELSSMRTVVYGGSSIAPDRLARSIDAFGEVFVQFFGLSETPMPLSALSTRDHRLDEDGGVPPRLASAGRVSPFVQLQLRDELGAPVGAGDVGEIVVRGDNVMAGYWRRPEQTAEMIDADGWAATGDLGRLDEEGYLYIVDRKRDMIVTGGFNVYPTEVENAIAALPAVQEVAVVGVPDDRWGESIHAVVVPRADMPLAREDVVGACTARLADFKKPRSIEFADELPKTGSGKVMRRAIRDRYWADKDRGVG